jgi:hypothetical protein
MTYIDFWVAELSRNPQVKEALEPMMKWKNVHKDALPADGQQVLLAVEGIYYCTTYSAERRIFRLKDEPDSFFAVEDNAIYYWVEIDEPPVMESVPKADKAS